jgi:chaperone BCS1
MIEGLLIEYNTFINSVFGGNQMLISTVTFTLTGAMVYLSRSLFFGVLNLVKKELTTTVMLDSSHVSYHKILNQLSYTNIIENARCLGITNGRWGGDNSELSAGEGRQILNLFGKLCLIKIEQVTHTGGDNIVYKMTIIYLGRSHEYAKKILELSQKEISSKVNLIVYDAVTISSPSYQRRDNLQSRVLREVEMRLIKDIAMFIKSEEWYINNGLQYQFGTLLHGVPGTGKTSIVRYIATKFSLPIYVINNFNDYKKIPLDVLCIIIIDEIDKVIDMEPTKGEDSVLVDQKILSLKVLDGIDRVHGHIIITTTNHIDKLEPALLRTGRLGKHYKFDYINKEEMKKYIIHHFENADISSINLSNLKSNITPVNINEYLIDHKDCMDCEQFIKHFSEV